MRRITIAGRIPATLALALGLAITAPCALGAQRAFVASTGLDTNDCSLIHPCRTFGVAIASASAGGEVVVLDSGGYGGVTITKAITIVAPAGIYAGISVNAGDGITIAAGATDTVKLRGLRINGLGGANGIVATSVGLLDVANVEVTGFTNHGLSFAAPGAQLVVADSLFEGNAVDGVHVESAGAMSYPTIVNTRAFRNANSGFTVGANTYAVLSGITASRNIVANVLVTGGAKANISDCTIGGPETYTTWNISIRSTGSVADIARCTITGGAYGVIAYDTGTRATVVDTTVSAPYSAGVTASNNGEVTAERCTIVGGTFSMSTGAGGTLHASNSTLFGAATSAFNTYAVNSTVYTRGNNTVRGTPAVHSGAGTFSPFTGN